MESGDDAGKPANCPGLGLSATGQQQVSNEKLVFVLLPKQEGQERGRLVGLENIVVPAGTTHLGLLVLTRAAYNEKTKRTRPPPPSETCALFGNLLPLRLLYAFVSYALWIQLRVKLQP